FHQSVLHDVTPIYETIPGWQSDLTSVSHVDQMPIAALDYVRFLEEKIGVPIAVVGVGPDREQFVLTS
ncbi:MAG: adenylosuccinate synthetase, partial [Acidimicrobiales bacterium]